MKVVDEGKMLLNGQVHDQGSSGLNNVDNKAEAEAEVREQESDAFVIVERVFCFASIILFLRINCDLKYHLISFAIISLIRIKSLP